MARIDIDTNETPPISNDFEPIPTGNYLMELAQSEVKPTKPKPGRNPGERLACTFVIVEDGPYKNRKIFSGFNLVNDNEEAVKISRGQLSALVRACGKIGVGDSEELHGIPFIGHVKLKPASGQYDDSNEVNGFKPADGTAPQQPPRGTGKDGKSAPWGRKG
jgi:hypothetical protein